jgi:hypothetical protein
VDGSPQTLFQAAFPVSVFSAAVLILVLAYMAWIEVALRDGEWDPIFGTLHENSASLTHTPTASGKSERQPSVVVK